VGDVDAEAVDAPVEPERDDGEELLAHLLVVPVEVRLGRVEDVEVPLAGGAVGLGDPAPAAAAEERRPVVGRELAVLTAAVAEEVAGPLGAARRGRQRRLEPRVLARGVVGHEVDQDPEPELVRCRDEGVGVVEGAEDGVDVAVVGDVVARVVHRRDVERGQPDGLHPQVAQVGEPGRDAGQVAETVAVAVHPAARVDLVDHRMSPPGRVVGLGGVHESVGGRVGLSDERGVLGGGGRAGPHPHRGSPWPGRDHVTGRVVSRVDHHERGALDIVAHRVVLLRR
jgi:hypothetical protein